MKIKFFLILFSLIILIFSFNALAFDHIHRKGDKILKRFLVVKGPVSNVKYIELKKNITDLNIYLADLQKVSQVQFNKFSKNQQLAFLINAYNFYTLKLIAVNYPIKSIKDLGSLFSSPWSKKFNWLLLFQKKVTLDQIEHNMIRGKEAKPFKGNYKEPRIHFALTCASIGCPMLDKRTYKAKSLKRSLETATRRFLSDKKRNYFDKEESKLYLSKIFNWYGKDFSHLGGVKKFVSKRITKDPDIKLLIEREDVKIRSLKYDWNLNDAS